MLPGLDTAVYDVIVLPPLLAGAVKVTVAVVNPVEVAVPTVGAPGSVYGVMLLLGPPDALLPTALVA
jgi:hypothetical protein